MYSYKRRIYRKKKGGMTLEELRSNNEEFYNFLKEYTVPSDNRFIHDIYNDFNKPYSDDIKINNLIGSVDNLDNIPVYYYYKGLLDFKIKFEKIYQFFKYLLLLDDATIVRILNNSLYMREYVNNDYNVLYNSLFSMQHHDYYRDKYTEFLKSYCNTININREKRLYSSNKNLIDFIRENDYFYKYLREIKNMSVDEIIELLNSVNYDKNNHQKNQIVIGMPFFLEYTRHHKDFFNSFDKYLQRNQLSDTDLKNYILDIETQIREEAEHDDNYNSAASTHKNSISSRSNEIVGQVRLTKNRNKQTLKKTKSKK